MRGPPDGGVPGAPNKEGRHEDRRGGQEAGKAGERKTSRSTKDTKPA